MTFKEGLVEQKGLKKEENGDYHRKLLSISQSRTTEYPNPTTAQPEAQGTLQKMRWK